MNTTQKEEIRRIKRELHDLALALQDIPHIRDDWDNNDYVTSALEDLENVHIALDNLS
jgi:hypothetical protein